MMDAWTNKAGYPVIKVTANTVQNLVVTITQKAFGQKLGVRLFHQKP